jgi:hypothetical protein
MKKIYLLKFFAAVSVIVVVSLIPLLNKNSKVVNASPASVISLMPQSVATSQGQDFSLEAKITPNSNQITAVEVHINYDATKFQISSIAGGSAFPSVLQAGQFDNSAGTASIIVGVAPSNPPAPVTTETTVATFNFNAIGQSGTSNVTFTTNTVAAAIGESGNVITTRNYAQITMGRTYGNSDFAALVSDWQKNLDNSPADVNADNVVNSKDLGVMMSNWGN